MIQKQLAIIGFLMLSFLLTATSAVAEHQIVTSLGQVQITFSLPEMIKQGATESLKVSVRAAAGQTPPDKIRARLGMPDHGHWITQQAFHPFAEGELAFSGRRCTEGKDPVISDKPGIMCIDPWFKTMFPMSGTYRFRVWLDYADGGEIKTAIDLDVLGGEPLNPRVIE